MRETVFAHPEGCHNSAPPSSSCSCSSSSSKPATGGGQPVRSWVKQQGLQEGHLRRSAANSYPYLSFSAASAIVERDADGLVAGEEQAVRAWLRKQGLREGDLRRDANMSNKVKRKMDGFLLEQRDLGAVSEQVVRSWLKRQGFEETDLRSFKEMQYGRPMTPMMAAAMQGQLHVCKWLYAHGAAADVTKANKYGDTPMFWACQKGHLSVCKWLFKKGAAPEATNWKRSGAAQSDLYNHDEVVDITKKCFGKASARSEGIHIS